MKPSFGQVKRKAAAITVAGLMGALSGLVGLNGAIRATGGRPGWLDPRHLSSKLSAVRQFAWHWVGHTHGPLSIEAELSAAAGRAGVPLPWMRTFAQVESGLRPHVISHAGAMGLMQLMPATARELKVGDPFDPGENAAGGAKYLAQLRKRYGHDLRRVAAAYHAGPNAVSVSGPMRVGPQTQRYVRSIVRQLTANRRQRSASL